MRRQAGQAEKGLPEALACYGTEPFWSFERKRDGSAKLSRPDAEVPFESTQVVRSENLTDHHALFADGGDTVATALIARNQCNDGMSDRAFGLSLDLLVTDQTSVKLYSGCCSVSK